MLIVILVNSYKTAFPAERFQRIIPAIQNVERLLAFRK